MAQTNVLVPLNNSGVSIAAFPITWNSVNSNLQGLSLVDPSTLNAAAVTAAGTPGTVALVVQGTGTSGTVPVSGSITVGNNITIAALPGSPAQDGTDGTGISQPTGGVGIRGWLSGIYKSVNSAIISSTNESAVSVGGLNTTLTNLSSATSAAPLYIKATGGRICRIINTATSATASGVTVTLLNQSSGAAVGLNTIYSFTQMAAGQIIDLQMVCNNGIGIYASGALANNIALTWS